MIRTITASALALFASANTVFAQNTGRAAVDTVGGLLSGVTSTPQFGSIAVDIALKAIPVINGVAFLVIVIAGMLAVVAQDENRIANARKVAVMALIGLVLINIAAQITQAILTAFDFGGGVNPDAAAGIIETELHGVISFVEVPIIVLSIVTIIVYGIKAVLDYGGDQGMQ
ncbi:MAG: hypothetical protein QF815_03015, partial [Candidatus Peribacteraceae bacterium]|nr:hypothetical protein [Candidatus Peribacteraceae bacterium]